MKDEYLVSVESEPKASDMSAIVKGLSEFNASKAGGERPNYLLITVRAPEGSVVGGLLGATYLGWLQVQAIWLPDELRGRGYGSTLMDLAETEAIRRGCPRVFLETLSFQALSFYEKRGYSIFSRLPDFPPGGARYALTKMLADDAEKA